MNKKNINKYYVGSADIARFIERGSNSPYTCKTLDEAITRAKKVMNEEDRTNVIIVSIIRIVKRKDQPIVVEKV